MGNWNCGQERLEAELSESGEKERKRAERSTRLPVLVKCCVLSKQQPRMCQPSRLTLPNGLLNADIKLARSFTLPLFLSCSFFFCLRHLLSLPLVLALSLTLSLTCPLPLFHSPSVALSTSSCLFPLLSFLSVWLLRLFRPYLLSLLCRLFFLFKTL